MFISANSRIHFNILFFQLLSIPGGFSLELGLKDVSLVSQAARYKQVPMPFLSVLLDRYTSAKAKGRADFDWSAIGLNVAEDAG